MTPYHQVMIFQKSPTGIGDLTKTLLNRYGFLTLFCNDLYVSTVYDIIVRLRAPLGLLYRLDSCFSDVFFI